jgi:tetratricopeptide (TPR) repeat protein/predicted MPP superfamily phosphohydrolase
MPGQASLWPNVEEMFLSDLRSLHERVGPWDLVSFTGDLTQSGTKPEFDAVEALLQRLWSHFREWGFTPKLLAIPGNHDLIRPNDKADPALLTLLHTWDQPMVQTPFWEKEDSPQRLLISRAFQPFTDWWARTSIPKPTTVNQGLLPGDWSAVVAVGEFKLGLIGLNSAYLQLAGGDFKRRLNLDVRQLHGVCDGHAADWTKQQDACLLLTHHPVDWLSAGAQNHFADEIHHPPERFVLHLFGHMHEGNLTTVSHGGGIARRTLQACSLFGLEEWGDPPAKREHGYSLCELKSEGDALRLRIWPRRAIKKPGGGRKLERDVSSFELDEGDGGTAAVVVKRFRVHHGATPRHGVSIPPPKTAEQYNPSNPPFYVPYRQKGAQVIGRQGALKKVHQQLTSGRRTAIGQSAVFQGIGGLGKTQLAVEYVYLYRDTYPNGVIWLTADQDIDAQLVDLAVKARWVAPESEHSVKLEIARHRLRRYSKTLIVFDNLERMESIQDYLPEHPAEPHILATSRTEQPDFTYVPIEVLDPDQSLQLLNQEAGRQPQTEDDWAAARQIAKLLGGLPLALELVGAYLLRRPIGWQDYVALLQRNLKKALPARLSSLTGHAADLYSTLQISEGVFTEEPRLRDILDVLTWSAPSPMGLDLLSSLVGAKEHAELIGALGLGVALRIVHQTPESNRYAIHRLVQHVRREEMPLADRAAWAAELCERSADWFGASREDFVQLPSFEAEIDHLREWHEHSLRFAAKQSSRLTWLQAYPAYHRGLRQEIKRHVEIALDEYQQQHCDDRQLLAHLYHDLAYSLDFTNPKRALELAERALAIRRELFGERHPETARSLNSVASYHHALGNPKRALEMADQALVIRRELFGERHPDTANSLNNVASCTDDLGNPKRALELANQGLAIQRELFGDWHPNTANFLSNVAGYYHDAGNPKRALELAEQALAIRRDLVGERHPDTATSLSNIASHHNALGDPKRALELAEEALAIQRELFGERHAHTASFLNNIASYHYALADPRRALERAEQALAIRRELFGDRHRETADSLHNLALILRSLGEVSQAHARATAALEARKQVLGANHTKTLATLALLRALPGFRAPSQKKPKTRRGKRG